MNRRVNLGCLCEFYLGVARVRLYEPSWLQTFTQSFIDFIFILKQQTHLVNVIAIRLIGLSSRIEQQFSVLSSITSVNGLLISDDVMITGQGIFHITAIFKISEPHLVFFIKGLTPSL